MDTFKCGHPKSPENCQPNGKNYVVCRECKRARQRRWRERNLEAERKRCREYMRAKLGEPKGSYQSRLESCPQGHPYNEENTYRYKNGRQCKKCRRIHAAKWWRTRRANGGSHTDAEWQALCDLLGNQCLRCKRTDTPLTRDHVLPVSKGGLDSIENIQPLCAPCNSGKKDRHIDYRPDMAEFLEREQL